MRWSVTALSPVLVGDGRSLAPVDYMVWRDQVNVLHQDRICRLLAKGPRFEGFLNQLRSAGKLDFATWGGFAQNYAARRIPFEQPSYTPVWQQTPAPELFIPTFAAGPQGQYLPASALRGAFRTAATFGSWTDATLGATAARVSAGHGTRRPGAVAQAAAPGSAATAASVRFADSAPVEASAFRVYMAGVAKLTGTPGGGDAAVWKPSRSFVEMAVPGTRFEGRYQNAASAPPLRQAVRNANMFAVHQLDAHAAFASAARLAALAGFVAAVKRRLEDVQAQGSACLLNLGWGTGLLSKVPVGDDSWAAYRALLRLFPDYVSALKTGAAFPKTRHLLFTEGAQPPAGVLPGWVLLEFEPGPEW